MDLAPILREAAERIESLALLVEFGALSEEERTDLLRKARITHQKLQQLLKVAA